MANHSAEIDWSAAVDETVHHLQTLIRFPTVNPPGNEIEAATYIADLLRAEGLDPVLIESAPSRGNVIARLRGEGKAPPLLLISHLDVVPVEPDQWTHDPFGGEVDQGMVWGRGALDMKGIVAMQLMTFLLLHRRGVPLTRDVIFAATADEEAGGTYGARYLVENHPELIRAEVALSEFGGFNMTIAGKRFYLIQSAEKGICQFRLQARGTPGHGSIPHPDNALVKLADAVARLGHARLPYRLTLTTEAFVRGIVRHSGGLTGLVMRALLHPRTGEWFLQHGPLDEGSRRTFYAMFHNTLSPTVLRGGEKVNVIPSRAEALIDARILPGDDQEHFFAQVRRIIGDELEMEPYLYEPALQQPMDTPMWHLMVQALQNRDPAAAVLPLMVTGATDAKSLARLSIPCYGFAPMQFPPGLDFLKLIHGHDERIPISALAFGLPVLYNVVRTYATS